MAALAAGAGTDAADTRSGAVRDTHARLKSLLSSRLAGHRQASEALQAEETQPGVWRSRIGDDLNASGAAADQEVLAAARRLLALLGDDAIKYWVNVRRSRDAPVGDQQADTQ